MPQLIGKTCFILALSLAAGCKQKDCEDPAECDTDTEDDPKETVQHCVLPPDLPDFIELPHAYVDTTLPIQTGTEITVQAGESIQDAIDSAQPGDTILLEAGASWTEEVHLTDKGETDEWIVIRSSNLEALPDEGVRATPEDAAQMAEILSPNGDSRALFADPNAHHYRVIGVVFGVAPGVNESYGIIDLGRGKLNGEWVDIDDRPHHIVLDRTVIRGIPEPEPVGNEGTKYGVLFAGSDLAVIDSTIYDIKKVGQDNQAITGSSGSGPYKITNNRLEAAGENILFGGTDTPDGDHNAQDMEICGNHILKPLEWYDTSYPYNARWSVKNLVEFKHGQRVLLTRNIIENNWASAQTGWSILIRSTDQYAGNNNDHQQSDNIVIAYNQLLNVTHGIDINARGSGSLNAGPTRNIYVGHNLMDRMGTESDFGGKGWLFLLEKELSNIVIANNTAFNVETYMMTNCTGQDGQNCGNAYPNAIENLQIRDNIMNYGDPGYGVHGSAGATDEEQFSNATDESSLLVNNILALGPSKQYPSETNILVESFEDVGFVDLAGGDYQLSDTSPYLTAGTDGGPIGADIESVWSHTANVRAGH